MCHARTAGLILQLILDCKETRLVGAVAVVARPFSQYIAAQTVE